MTTNKFKTLHDLITHTKGKIDDLHKIADVLLMEYRTASDMIGAEDYRVKSLSQLQELNQNISEIVDLHPAMTGGQKLAANVAYEITKIAATINNSSMRADPDYPCPADSLQFNLDNTSKIN